MDTSGWGQQQLIGPRGHDNETFCCRKGGEFLDQLTNCQILSKGFAPWR